MSFSHEYNFPLFVTNGSVLTSGHSSTLAPIQLGVFVDKTHNAVSGSPTKWDALRIMQGSAHRKDKLGNYFGGLKKSDESPAFLVSDILEFQKSAPRAAASEEWVLGWDGVSLTDTLDFDCATEYRFKIKVWGEDVYGTYLRPLEREIGFKTDCCAGDDCTQSCDDSVAGEKYAKLLAELINKDPELKYFVEAEAIGSDVTANAATHRLYCLSVCDAGTQLDLSAVQTSAGTSFPVEVIGRAGTITTYQTITTLDAPDGSPLATPADFTPTGSITLASCGVCPSGYTTVPGYTVYRITNPLDGSEDLTTSGARQTFATAIGTTYAITKTFNGATDVEVVATSDQITITAHGFTTGNKVKYSNGGGTTVVGLTNNSSYYIIKVSANVVKLATTAANAVAGTAIAISDGVGASHTLIAVTVATFLSQDGATATVELTVPEGLTLTALSADAVSAIRTVGTMCTPAAADPTSWTACGDRYKTTRTLHLTVERDCTGSNKLAEIVAYYASRTDLASAITVSTAGTCSDIYVVTQYNNALLEDGCLTEGVPEFDTLPTFEGFSWVPNADSAGTAGVKWGVRVRAAYEDTKFGGCSFHPTDYYSVRPLSLEITELVGGPGDTMSDPCVGTVPSRKIRYSSMPTQSGEWAIREYIKANKYRIGGEFYADPRLREVLDSMALEMIDRAASYTAYYFKVRAHRPVMNHVADFSPEIYEFQILAKQGSDTSALETLLGSVASLNGVYLQDR